MADFSLLQQPNFAQAALAGYTAGQKVGQQRSLDDAMSQIDLNRPETLLPVLRRDPSTGAALIGASVKLHAENRAQQTQDAVSGALGDYFNGKSASAGGSSTSQPALGAQPQPAIAPITAAPTPANPLLPTAPAAPGAAGAAPATTTLPGTDPGITVTASHPVAQMPPTLQQTVGRLVQGGVSLDDATKFVDLAGKMTKTQADALTDQQNAISSVATAIPKNLSPADRGAWVVAHKDFLLAHNVPEAKIDAFAANPTDENISAVQTMALGTKDALTQAREAAAQAETVKQHGIENAQGQQRIGIEAQNAGTSAAHLGIDRAHLALDTAKFKQTSGAGANGGGIATPASAADYKALPQGARYYKNGQVFIKGGQ